MPDREEWELLVRLSFGRSFFFGHAFGFAVDAEELRLDACRSFFLGSGGFAFSLGTEQPRLDVGPSFLLRDGEFDFSEALSLRTVTEGVRVF